MKIFNGIPKKRVIIDILFSCIWSFFNANLSKILAELVADIASLNDIMKVTIFFIIYIIIWEILEFIGGIYLSYTSGIIEANINKYYFNKLYKIKPSILKENNTGYISGVLHKLVVRQESAYRCLVMNVPICIVYIIFFSYQMWKYHWSFGLSLTLIVIIGNLFRFSVGKISERHVASLTESEGYKNKLIVDVVSNINTVQKMKSLNFMNENIDEKNNECLIKTRKWAIFEEMAFCGCKLLIFLYTPVVLIISNYINLGDKKIVFYNLLAVVSIQLVHNSKTLVNAISEHNRFTGCLSKLEKIIDKKNIRREILTEDFEYAKIENLEYSYKTNEDNTVVIKIPEFNVNKGDKVCIYGESGQGKTTLLHLLSGEIENNNTTINGTIKDKILDCVFIAQDTEIFDMSLRDNLTLGKFIPDKKLIHYLEMVGMLDWFKCQPEGLNTLLGERGVFVSTGQRQRLNLIRGLLISDKEVYLLDEPTSNVDEVTEESMVNLIKETLQDKTIIVVTHRPKIKEICNVIYKFENGIINLEKR